jgi:hypothetical protein
MHPNTGAHLRSEIPLYLGSSSLGDVNCDAPDIANSAVLSDHDDVQVQQITDPPAAHDPNAGLEVDPAAHASDNSSPLGASPASPRGAQYLLCHLDPLIN